MTNIFPTDYTTKVTPDWTDVVWSSDAVTNFNLTIASIALYTMTNSTTDDLSEWATNLYYTDTRVSANSTVVALWNDKQDVSNISSDMVADAWSTTKYPSVLAAQNAIDGFSLPDATEIVKGKTRFSTSTEVMERTDNTAAITPAKIWFESIIASNNIKSEANTERSVFSDASFVKVKEIEIGKYRLWGIIRSSFDVRVDTAIDQWQYSLRINGIQEFWWNVWSATYITITHDLSVVEWDLVQLYLQWFPLDNIYTENFNIAYDEIQSSLMPTVTLD